MMPEHYARPSGVPAFKPEEKKAECHHCGISFPEKQGHTVGNVDYPEHHLFCSSRCAMAAYERSRKMTAQKITLQADDALWCPKVGSWLLIVDVDEEMGMASCKINGEGQWRTYPLDNLQDNIRSGIFIHHPQGLMPSAQDALLIAEMKETVVYEGRYLLQASHDGQDHWCYEVERTWDSQLCRSFPIKTANSLFCWKTAFRKARRWAKQHSPEVVALTEEEAQTLLAIFCDHTTIPGEDSPEKADLKHEIAVRMQKYHEKKRRKPSLSTTTTADLTRELRELRCLLATTDLRYAQLVKEHEELVARVHALRESLTDHCK